MDPSDLLNPLNPLSPLNPAHPASPVNDAVSTGVDWQAGNTGAIAGLIVLLVFLGLAGLGACLASRQKS